MSAGLGDVPAVQIKGFGLDHLAAAELDTVFGHRGDAGLYEDLDAAFRELLLRISTQLGSEFGQDHVPGMNQDDPQHVFAQIVIKMYRLPNKVVDPGDGFNTGEPSAGYDKREQWAPHVVTAFDIRLFQ